MANIKYLGPEDTVTCMDREWSSSKWTDSSDLSGDNLAILSGNPYFSVKGADFTPPSPEVGRDETAQPSGVGESDETPATPDAA